MAYLRFQLAVLLFVAGSALLSGCATAEYHPRMVAAETYTVNPPQAVFDSPPVVAGRQQRSSLAVDVPTNDQGQPWWTTRNDDRLAVRPGSSQVRVTRYQIHVRDRQYSYGDQVHNYYRREFHSHTAGQLVD